MSLFQVEVEQHLKRRFFIECDEEDEAREAAVMGLADKFEPFDWEDDDIEVYRLPPDAAPDGPIWRGGPEGSWEDG